MKFTVIGASGFVGSHLRQYLVSLDHSVSTPARGDELQFVNTHSNIGHVIYAIGLTANFRQKPFETVRAHVSKWSDLIQRANFDSWIYLSSTRVYAGLSDGALASEDSFLKVIPSLDMIYNLSKLTGESICVSQDNPKIRVARLSNVYGVGMSGSTFLSSVIQESSSTGAVTINEGPKSSKDYVSVEDVSMMLTRIALEGQSRIYNIASGQSTTHYDIANALTGILGCDVNFAPNANQRNFPPIDVGLLVREFGYNPKNLLNDMEDLVPQIVSKVA